MSSSISAERKLLTKRFGKIKEATDYSGFGRTKLYGLAASNPGLFRKFGSATLVDFQLLDALLDGLPFAHIRPANNSICSDE
jgi:hypothetical protein